MRKNTNVKPPTKGLQQLHDYLLTATANDLLEIKQIPSLIMQFSSHLHEQQVPFWEKALMSDVWWHLGSYYPYIWEKVNKQLVMDGQFSTAFTIIPARKAFLKILEQDDMCDRLRALLKPFRSLESITKEDILPAIKSLSEGDGSLTEEEELSLYRAVNAASTLNRVVSETLSNELYGCENLPWNLVCIWNRIFPKLDTPERGRPPWHHECHIFFKCEYHGSS